MLKVYIRIMGGLVLSAVSLSLNVSCVTTRAELRGEDRLSTSERRPVTVQQLRAQEALRDQEYQEQLRELHGRIESLEHQLQVVLADKLRDLEGSQREFMDSRFKLYEEALANSEKKLSQVLAELSELKKKEVSPAVGKAASSGPASAFIAAERLFEQKRWREAIVEYQRYRESQPRGEHYAEATYKIGVCFQELNMAEEARAFYQEALDRFPGSGAARRSATRLRSL